MLRVKKVGIVSLVFTLGVLISTWSVSAHLTQLSIAEFTLDGQQHFSNSKYTYTKVFKRYNQKQKFVIDSKQRLFAVHLIGAKQLNHIQLLAKSNCRSRDEAMALVRQKTGAKGWRVRVLDAVPDKGGYKVRVEKFNGQKTRFGTVFVSC